MSDGQSMERLKEGGRILGASRVLRHGQDVTADAAKQVIANVAAFIAETKLSWAKIARAIGCSGGTLSGVVHSIYAGNWQQIIIDLDVWLEDELKRRGGQQLPGFVMTTVAKEIFTVADVAISLKTIGVVFGGSSSGIGKTVALHALAREKPGTIYVSIETLKANPQGVAAAIGEAMRVYLGHTYQTAWQWLSSIKQSLRDTPRLLIVDEIHKLCTGRNDGGLHLLRDLHDQTGIPMLWCGTTDLVAYLERRQHQAREPLSQIRSRIGICRDLTSLGAGKPGGPAGGEPRFTTEEIRRVFANQKMQLAPAAARYLYELANLPDAGHLRTCVNLLRMATMINERHATVLTAEMLRGAHQLMTDRHAYDTVEAKLEQERRTLQAVPA